jgi:cell division protein FtsB
LSIHKKKFLKISLVVLCILGAILAWLAFGEQGLTHLYRTEMARQACIDRIRELARENQTLIEEIDRLHTDMEYVESVVRKEFNLIKENEIIYRFNKDETPRNGIGTPHSKARHDDERRRSRTEVRHDGEIK